MFACPRCKAEHDKDAPRYKPWGKSKCKVCGIGIKWRSPLNSTEINPTGAFVPSGKQIDPISGKLTT